MTKLNPVQNRLYQELTKAKLTVRLTTFGSCIMLSGIQAAPGRQRAILDDALKVRIDSSKFEDYLQFDFPSGSRQFALDLYGGGREKLTFSPPRHRVRASTEVGLAATALGGAEHGADH